jgi:hypothetical protein
VESSGGASARYARLNLPSKLLRSNKRRLGPDRFKVVGG